MAEDHGRACGGSPRLTLPGSGEDQPRWNCWDRLGRAVFGVPDDIARRLCKTRKDAQRAPVMADGDYSGKQVHGRTA
jgi:hypothetical protein